MLLHCHILQILVGILEDYDNFPPVLGSQTLIIYEIAILGERVISLVMRVLFLENCNLVLFHFLSHFWILHLLSALLCLRYNEEAVLLLFSAFLPSLSIPPAQSSPTYTDWKRAKLRIQNIEIYTLQLEQFWHWSLQYDEMGRYQTATHRLLNEQYWW